MIDQSLWFCYLEYFPVASVRLQPNDMESIINSANQYARDIERIDADSNTDSTDTSGLTRKERKEIKKTRLDKIHQTKEGALK
jgi:hypothetical protein